MTKKKQNPAEEVTGNRPARKLRLGAIHASVWRNEGDNGPYYTVGFERRYLDKGGEWQSSQTYRAGDLLELAKLADMTHTAIYKLQKETDES